jgi:hypothetical protein
MVPPDSCPGIDQETLIACTGNKGKEGRFSPVIKTPEAIIKPRAWFGTKFGGWHQTNKGFEPGPRNQVNRTPRFLSQSCQGRLEENQIPDLFVKNRQAA